MEIQYYRLEEDHRANDFIDYQNPYMFLEFPNKVLREQYDDHKALYPSVEDMQEGITNKIEDNKSHNNLNFKLWFKEMDDKLQKRIKRTKEEEE